MNETTNPDIDATIEAAQQAAMFPCGDLMQSIDDIATLKRQTLAGQTPYFVRVAPLPHDNGLFEEVGRVYEGFVDDDGDLAGEIDSDSSCFFNMGDPARLEASFKNRVRVFFDPDAAEACAVETRDAMQRAEIATLRNAVSIHNAQREYMRETAQVGHAVRYRPGHEVNPGITLGVVVEVLDGHVGGKPGTADFGHQDLLLMVKVQGKYALLAVDAGRVEIVD